MYDLQLDLLVCGKDKYLQRLLDFKRYGLLNVGHTSVLVKLLVGTEHIDDRILREGWPAGVHTEVVTAPGDTVVNKLYHLYANMAPEEALKARWFSKFDDDSVTDVTGLVCNLDADYDHEREYYLCARLLDGVQDEEYDAIRQIGCHRLIEPGTKPLTHEFEGSVMSTKAFQRMLKSPEVMKFFDIRWKMATGYGDNALAVAARIAKVYPLETSFMTELAEIGSLSVFGGRLNHIHFVARDIDPVAYEVYVRIISGAGWSLSEKIGGRRFVLTHHEGLRMMKLKANGFVEGGHDICMWTSEDETLYLFDNLVHRVGEFKMKDVEGGILSGMCHDHPAELLALVV